MMSANPGNKHLSIGRSPSTSCSSPWPAREYENGRCDRAWPDQTRRNARDADALRGRTRRARSAAILIHDYIALGPDCSRANEASTTIGTRGSHSPPSSQTHPTPTGSWTPQMRGAFRSPHAPSVVLEGSHVAFPLKAGRSPPRHRAQTPRPTRRSTMFVSRRITQTPGREVLLMTMRSQGRDLAPRRGTSASNRSIVNQMESVRGHAGLATRRRDVRDPGMARPQRRRFRPAGDSLHLAWRPHAGTNDKDLAHRVGFWVPRGRKSRGARLPFSSALFANYMVAIEFPSPSPLSLRDRGRREPCWWHRG